MKSYIMINRDGKDCGIKELTDAMAERLENSGWELIPAGSEIQVTIAR